jgi:hypothetical protein
MYRYRSIFINIKPRNIRYAKVSKIREEKELVFQATQRTKLENRAARTTCISVVSNSDSILFSFESQKGCDRSKCFLSRVSQICESTETVLKKLTIKFQLINSIQ